MFVAAVAILYVTLAERPFDGLSRPVIVAGSTLTLFAAWTLVSASWSDAPGRALVEFDRALLYALLFLLYGCAAPAPSRVRWMVRGVAGAFSVIGLFGLVSRVLPETLTVDASYIGERLSYPTTYWNTTGLCAAIGALLCFHLTSDEREPAGVRIAAAAAIPALSTALLFTFSRGAILALAVGLIVYAVVGRPRGLLGSVPSVVPATAVAVIAAYRADALASSDPASAAAIAEGRDLAPLIAVCMVIAALLRLAAVPLDRRVARIEIGKRGRRGGAAACGAIVLAGVIAAVALGAPGEIARQYDRFATTSISTGGDVRSRLGKSGNNGRLNLWRASVDSWERRPLLGTGAGTYQVEWARTRPGSVDAIDGHSIFLEPLGELGVIGAAALMITLFTILGVLAARTRGPNRALYAALLAAIIAWLLRAGLDWDWEMPVVTAWLFALGGAALASAQASSAPRPPGRTVRIAIGAGLLILAVAPAQLAVSQARLNDAVSALRADDCEGAIKGALDSLDAVGARAEPYELIAYCDVKLGLNELAQRAARNAINRDPNNWEYHYDLAIVQGASGVDPRPATEEARRLNPNDALTRDLSERFDTADPRKWRRRARGPPPRPLQMGGGGR